MVHDLGIIIWYHLLYEREGGIGIGVAKTVDDELVIPPAPLGIHWSNANGPLQVSILVTLTELGREIEGVMVSESPDDTGFLVT